MRDFLMRIAMVNALTVCKQLGLVDPRITMYEWHLAFIRELSPPSRGPLQAEIFVLVGDTPPRRSAAGIMSKVENHASQTPFPPYINTNIGPLPLCELV